MKTKVVIDVEDYVYQFYQVGANALRISVVDAMERALYMYADLVANDMNQKNQAFINLSNRENERPQ